VEPRGDLAFLHARAAVDGDHERAARRLLENDLIVWDRYAPDAIRNRLMHETIQQYDSQAEDGAECRVPQSSAGPCRRRPLSQEQFESLFGLAQARERLHAQRDGLHGRRIGVWGRGRGCPQLLDLLRELNLEPVAVYETRGDDGRWSDCPLRDTGRVVADRLDALVPGTFSLGTAADQAADLRASFPEVPTLQAIDWSTTLR